MSTIQPAPPPATRDVTLDILRVVGIAAVVVAHVWFREEWAHAFIFSWNMPLFFFLTGYLWKDRPFGPMVKRRVRDAAAAVRVLARGMERALRRGDRRRIGALLRRPAARRPLHVRQALLGVLVLDRAVRARRGVLADPPPAVLGAVGARARAADSGVCRARPGPPGSLGCGDRGSAAWCSSWRGAPCAASRARIGDRTRPVDRGGTRRSAALRRLRHSGSCSRSISSSCTSAPPSSVCCWRSRSSPA